jgi:hypothetical protein
MNLRNASAADVSGYGRDFLSQYRDTPQSFESIAQIVVQSLYETFKREDSSPLFALTRIYRLTRYTELPSDLKGLVEPARERWMTLMGTYGIEPAWCDRQQSQGHKALNLGEDQSPMVSAAIYQIGLDLGIKLPQLDIDLPIPEVSLMTRYFHVEHAVGSRYIPAQDSFVKPYGIQSVVGIGSVFVSGSAHLLLCFAREHVSADDAQKFAQIAPFVSTLLAYFDERSIWQAA